MLPGVTTTVALFHLLNRVFVYHHNCVTADWVLLFIFTEGRPLSNIRTISTIAFLPDALFAENGSKKRVLQSNTEQKLSLFLMFHNLLSHGISTPSTNEN